MVIALFFPIPACRSEHVSKAQTIRIPLFLVHTGLSKRQTCDPWRANQSLSMIFGIWILCLPLGSRPVRTTEASLCYWPFFPLYKESPWDIKTIQKKAEPRHGETHRTLKTSFEHTNLAILKANDLPSYRTNKFSFSFSSIRFLFKISCPMWFDLYRIN